MAARQRLLIKMAPSADRPFSLEAGARAFALDGLRFKLEPLFRAPREAGLGVAAGAADWYLATPEDTRFGKEWDAAHALMEPQAFAAARAEGVEFVEPDLEQEWLPERLCPVARFAAAPDCTPKGQDDDFPTRPDFAWHLDDGFSQLRRARAAADGGAGVVIVHLDTGYDPGHEAAPARIDTSEARNFVEGLDDPAQLHNAVDRGIGGVLRQPGHGPGTLGILASRAFGGAPDATIVPVRIANSVVHFWTSSVAHGLAHARRLAERPGAPAVVVSMSMGGVASAAWADAVNAAYEAGVVIVCAAGNNFGGAPTRFIVYPARFKRVIAACGVMANMKPYFGLLPWQMQGNHGPPSKMATALSAFTPNIPWAQLGCRETVHQDGAGTSSATPQIAAAAALWLAKHGAGLPRDWRRVEAVRRALFKLGAGGEAPPIDEALGRGVLRAADALAVGPRMEGLTRTPEDSASFSWLRVLTGIGLAAAEPRGRAQAELLRLEMTQLAQKMKALKEAVPDPDLPAERIGEKQRRRFVEAILDSREGSLALNRFLERQYGRAGVPVEPAARPKRAAPPDAAREAAPAERLDGSHLVRHAPPAPPAYRRLRIFAIDPGAGGRLDTAFVNQTVVKVPWERSPTNANLLAPGPVGEYVEVVDVDPASQLAYRPIDLNDRFILAEDGLAPSEGDPRFHQQMVYAVAMMTIRNFELALGRVALWATRHLPVKIDGKDRINEVYVPRLRIYPHALRQANAFYSPEKVALLFGYFPAETGAPGAAPGHTVFTCLSHDIIAHETAHALLDGLHRRFKEATNPDVFAFHEAFADIVAIFQHFTFPDLLRHVVRATRGNLAHGELLASLARQFGQASGRSGALRSAIGRRPDPAQFRATQEPHDRGAALVAAVFDAFLAIYKRRTADLFRLATGGTGVLKPGAIHTDLVERLADEAAKTAQRVLTICIRALDYMPPVDIGFGDYLRALITADHDLVPDDPLGYRIAFIEAFQARGIDVDGVRSLSVDSLRWKEPVWQPPGFRGIIRDMDLSWDLESDRLEAFAKARANAIRLHGWIRDNVDEEGARHLGLDFRPGADGRRPKFEVHSVRPARRVASNGGFLNELVIVVTQRRRVPLDPDNPALGMFWFRGGATWLVDARDGNERIRYAVMKGVGSPRRLERQRRYRTERLGHSLSALYFGEDEREPFALLHTGL